VNGRTERMQLNIRHCNQASDERNIWNRIAWIGWSIVVLILILRPLQLSHRGTSFDTYQLAGLRWLHGEDVYSQWMGFVYSPLIAAFFAPFALVPAPLANIVWRLLNTAFLLGGISAIINSGLFSGIGKQNAGIPYLLLIPLAVGNIDISQANPLVAGLILLAIAAVYRERWNVAAVCIALATSLKIYPIAVGLLICVIAPRRFTGRFIIALFLAAATPFLLQHWAYVSGQYLAWIATRVSDNRHNWPIEKLPLDLWFLIHWLGRIPISPRVYTCIQLGAAGALAVLCAVQGWRGWSKTRILIALFVLVSVWMTLCGPATESYTYLILAPALVLTVVHAYGSCQPLLLRTLVSAAFILQFVAAARASFLPHFKPFWALSIQPLSAVALLLYAVLWLFDATLWSEGGLAKQ
jgi:hypothetical protein